MNLHFLNACNVGQAEQINQPYMQKHVQTQSMDLFRTDLLCLNIIFIHANEEGAAVKCQMFSGFRCERK